jgi:hypothetical protein
MRSGSARSHSATCSELWANGSFRVRHQCVIRVFQRPWSGRERSQTIQKRAQVIAGPRRWLVAATRNGPHDVDPTIHILTHLLARRTASDPYLCMRARASVHGPVNCSGFGRLI